MIKIDFNADLENKGLNSYFKYKLEKTTTFEVECLIAKLIQLILKNDEKAKKQIILKEINTLYEEYKSSQKRKERNEVIKDGKSNN